MSEAKGILARRPLCSPGFTRRLLSELKIAERFRPEQTLYLTPNKRRARSAEFEILSLYRESALRSPDCLTLGTLAEKLVTAKAQKGIVDERDRRFILLNLIHKGGGLSFREEHLGLLSNLYSELKRHHPDDWTAIPERSKELVFDPDTAVRLKEAIELLGRYEEHLEKEGLVDHEGILEEAIGEIYALTQKLLIIEGYFEPWVAEQRLFDALLAHIHEALVIIPDHPLAVKGERFFLSYNLPQRPTPQSSPEPLSSWNRFPSREDEVRAIARRICALAEAGVDPHEIIVVFPALDTYRPIVERVFALYGLSAKVSLRPRLSSLPAIRQVLDLLHTVEQRFRRRDVVSILLSPSFTRVPERVRQWVDVLSRDEGVISGQTQWTDWFLSDLPRRLREHPEAAAIRNTIRRFVHEFVEKLRLLGCALSVEVFIEKLSEILDWLGWQAPDEAREGFDEALEKFCRMTDLAGESQTSLRFARQTLEIVLRKELLKPDEETQPDAIRVMPLVETRWLDARYLFVGGLVDGEFPERPYRDLLIPERLRESLGLPTVESQFANDEFEFKRLLAMPREEVFCSAPTMEDDRPLLASVFLAEREESPRFEDSSVYSEEERQILEPCEKPQVTEGVRFQDENSLELIGVRFGPRHPFKVTLLEAYRNCPYRYYLGTVLGLEIHEEPTSEPEARLLGTILHHVLEKLFENNPDLERIDEALWNELTLELDRRRLNPFVRIWTEDWVAARKDWFRDEELARAHQGWQVDPSWLERDLELYFAKEGFTLKGRVDRVDWIAKRARVLDYKTGKQGSLRDQLRKGEGLQLPLYSEMIRRLFKAEVSSFGMYDFLKSRLEEITQPLGEMRSALKRTAEAVVGIRQGIFESKKSQTCWYCEFKEFC